MTKKLLTDNEALDLIESSEVAAKDLGRLSDYFWDIKQKRLKADKVAAALKTLESGCEAKLIEQMLRQEISAVGGGDVIFTMGAPTQEPVVNDWIEYWDFIKKEDDMSLFERRPGRKAIKERWEAGEVIPGVSKFPVYKLSKQGVKK